MNYKIVFSFLKHYKVNFILLISVLSIGFFLIVFLLNMSKYKDYYFEYMYGNVPEWVILDKTYTLSEFKNKLDEQTDIDVASFGKYINVNKLSFNLNNEKLSYMIKNVYMFGFDYSQPLNMGISCGDKSTLVNIKKIYSTHATKWKIKTDSFSDITCKSGLVKLHFGNVKASIILKKIRSNSLLFEFDPNINDSKEFYSMLIAMVKQYTKVFKPTHKNSISTGSDKKDIYASRYKKSLQNYFSIIFSSSFAKSISSAYLSNQISNFQHMSQQYSILHNNYSSNIIIKDIINFPIDENSRYKYLSNSLFLKQSALPKYNDVKEKGNFAFVYTEKLDKIDNSLIYISKKHLLSQYLGNKKFISKLIYITVMMISIFIFIIITIALIRFYTLYKRDIFLLKIYSFSKLIYGQMILILVVFASIISYFSLIYSFERINNILMKYYQPILHFDMIYLVYVILTSIGALVLLLLIEYNIWKKISVSIK